MTSSYSDRWEKVRKMLHNLDQAATEKLVTDICLSGNVEIDLGLRLSICDHFPGLNEFLRRFPEVLFGKYKETYFQSYLKSYQSNEVFDIVSIAMWLDPKSCGDVGLLLEVRDPVLTGEELADRAIQFLKCGRNVSESLSSSEEIQHILTVSSLIVLIFLVNLRYIVNDD